MIRELFFDFDKEFKELGIKDIVFAQHSNLNNEILLPAKEFELITKKIVDSVTLITTEELNANLILSGYKELLKSIGRSTKKFPPSAQALIDIITRRSVFPRINPIVDIYNLEAIKSSLSLGVHDLAKIAGNTIYFKINKAENLTFFSIGGGEKKVNLGDYIYTDKTNVLAWLDTKDSELVKVDKSSKDILIIIQGNLNTTLDYRVKVLNNLCHDLKRFCGGDFAIGRANVKSGLINFITP